MNKKFLLLVVLFFSFLFLKVVFAENQTCTIANPSISISPSNQSGSGGSTLVYTINMRNNDNAYCNSTDFELTCNAHTNLNCLLVSSGGTETPSMIEGGVPPGFNWSRTVKVTSSASLGAGSYSFIITIDNGIYNMPVTKSASVIGYYNVQGQTVVTTEYRNMSVGETIIFDLAADNPYKWQVNPEDYDSSYFQHMGGVGCSPTGHCTYSFQFKALKNGETIIYIKKINTIDNSILEIKKIYVTIKSVTTCADSDGGINYFTKGCISLCTYANQSSGCGLACDTCSGNTLTEGYCDGNQSKTVNYVCPVNYICSDGACVAPTNVSTCGNRICESGEVSMMYYGQITSCPQDCGYELDPYEADINVCKDSSGRTYTIGVPPSVPWFIWGGCAHYKIYNVNMGQSLRLHVYTDSCSGCTCYHPNFDIYEYQNGVWTFSKSFSLNNVKGLNTNEYYTPSSNKIKIYARDCFYLDVFSPSPVTQGCVNHDECSQACDNLGISSKWMGSGNSYRTWEGTCPSRVYGCMTGKCCLGQCKQDGNCICQRTNLVDIYGSVCPEGTTCGDDCYCHPTNVEDYKFSVKTDKYSYSPGESVRITAIISGNSNYNDATIITLVTDSQGKQYDIKMEPIGASASTCTASATGTTCSISTEYHFVGSHNLGSDAPIGGYRIMSTAVSKGVRKNAENKFEVSKSYNDYVDISINPQEQLTHIGKEAKYDVTIIDKHPVMRCTPTNLSANIQPTTVEEKCGPQIYNYLIDVGGLPYHTVFPTVVSVHAGGSNTFELKVFPSSAKTEQGITTAVQTTTAAATTVERAVSITGKPIATEAKSGEFATAPVAAILREAVFKFAVKASLKEEYTTSDTAIGVLRVRFVEEPEPPPFPETEKIKIELKKGWNIVSVPGKGIRFTKGTCSEDQKPLAFVYLYEKQRYVNFEEALNVMGQEELLNYLSTHSFWIYSYEDCNIGFNFKSYSTYSGLKINEGWNLLGVTKDMIGETLNNIKGNCVFEKIYKWDSNLQKWLEKSDNDLIEEKGFGLAVKATAVCNLKTTLIQPPPFPGE